MVFKQKLLFEGASITYRDRRVTPTRDMFKGQGYDGEVYQVSAKEAVKLYKEPSSAERMKEKLSILCQKSRSLHTSVVAPTDLAFAEDTNGESRLAGFAMPLVSQGIGLENYVWKPTVTPDEEGVFDRTVADILYDICDALKAIHRARIVVGDLKPANLLVEHGKAYVIDFDSTAMPDYPAVFFTPDYLDPRLKGSSTADGPIPYDEESDWFALGVIAFQMFLGVVPWAGVNPQLGRDKRMANYSVVGFDPGVRAPKSRMRPLTWFNRNPLIADYFEGLFSPDASARYSIEYVLDRYFPVKKDRVRSNYRVRNISFDPALTDFTQPAVDEIRRRGRRTARSNPGEGAFVRLMLGRFPDAEE